MALTAIARGPMQSSTGSFPVEAVAGTATHCRLLHPGDRVWVKVPKRGYVGVARVRAAAVAAKEFRVETPRTGPDRPDPPFGIAARRRSDARHQTSTSSP